MATKAEDIYANGYERGRTICLTKGREAAKQWLKDHNAEHQQFVAGFRAAILRL